MSNSNFTTEAVKEYYGEVLSSSKDLQTSACCTAEAMPAYLLNPLKLIHDEIKDKFYGCGSPIPHLLKGKTVLDLGCGTGRDVYLLSQLVGEDGKVIGVDMTENQINVAKKYQDFHQDKFGHKKSNVSFHLGHIEDLKALGIEDQSVDVVVSNCVINLSPFKDQVFKEIFRVLKPGGELYFSDIFSSRRLPEEMANDKVLLGECLGGAMYTEDFRRIMFKNGVFDFRTMNNSKLTMFNKEIAAKIGLTEFYSITVRAFKIDLEDRCEDYGQVATYKGGIPHSENVFTLDDHHVFEKGRPMLVCRNTADMLQKSRFGEYFKVEGDTQTHFGLFDCAPTTSSDSAPGSCC